LLAVDREQDVEEEMAGVVSLHFNREREEEEEEVVRATDG
jgi:hypothetical protein